MATNSHVCLSFCVSLIDRQEFIADADLSSKSDSESVVEMFSIPPMAQEPQQQHQERLSSSLSNSTNRTRSPSTEELPPMAQEPQQQCQERLTSSLSNSTNRTRLPSNKGVSNAPRRRSPIGPFVYTSNGRTGIRSANHATGLIGILQIAGAHPNRLIGTLGFNNCQSWFQQNIDAIFQSDGPLGMFNAISPSVLARHFSTASNQAKEIYDYHHLNNQSGANHEDVPPWVQQFFRLFEPSRTCLLLPPRQLSLGARGAV